MQIVGEGGILQLGKIKIVEEQPSNIDSSMVETGRAKRRIMRGVKWLTPRRTAMRTERTPS